jgi:hypothetical protein
MITPELLDKINHPTFPTYNNPTQIYENPMHEKLDEILDENKKLNYNQHDLRNNIISGVIGAVVGALITIGATIILKQYGLL